mmetsp:Transcript_84408/g.176680  ORF Transcript_84408/g.176680 Transcript_84408/m.176680 type:complete len:442 (-) Transcript_84408:86-1411(-)
MEEEAVTYSDEEFVELLGFLSDSKLLVQQQAAEGVLDLTQNASFMDYCRRQPRKAAKPLLRLAEKAEAESATSSAAATLAAGRAKTPEQAKAARQAAIDAVAASRAGGAALKALVNMSAVPAVRDELIEMSAPRRIADVFKGGWLEGRHGLAHWYAMLLANLSTGATGQEALCKDEAMVQFLMTAFEAKKVAPRDGYEDPLLFLGKVMGNICACEAGRKILTGKDKETAAGTVKRLVNQLSDRARRPDVVSALRNLALDEECHDAVMDGGAFPSMARFLYPLEKVSADLKTELPKEVLEYLSREGAALTSDGPTRLASAFFILGLCRSQKGREYLRDGSAELIIKGWMQEENEEEVRNALEAAIPALTTSEEDLAKQQESSTGATEGAMADVAEAVKKVETTSKDAGALPKMEKSEPAPLPARMEHVEEGDMVELFEGIED